LETFYEERTTIWHQEPYTSQLIDGPENGQPPLPWDINVTEPVMFQPKEIFKEVPHTASIKVFIYDSYLHVFENNLNSQWEQDGDVPGTSKYGWT